MTLGLISIAGPLTNIVIGLLAAIPVYMMRESIVENSFQYLADINLRLAVWNLVPFYVFDGGKFLYGILATVLPANYVSWAQWIIGIPIFIGLMWANEVIRNWLRKL